MKPKTTNQKKAYYALNSRLVKYMTVVQGIYDRMANSLSIAIDGINYDGSAEFLFEDFPELRQTVNELMTDYVAQMNNLIYSGTSKEWRNSNLLQDLLARKVLKTYEFESKGRKYQRYFQSNSDALKAFQRRADNGMNLSQKLWAQSVSLRKELEQTISTAIDRGQSAVVLSKKISKYLNDFPSLKSDYSEKFGKAVTCRDCQYASIRLARTEINMAYRKAEQLRWKQFDFILGYEVKLSKSHPAPDICDELQGKYPKDYTFVGWHPNCMCYVVPIVMTDDEYYGNRQTVRKVDDVPENYKLWVRNNEDRIANWKSLPYFLQMNPGWEQYFKTGFHEIYEGRYDKAEKDLRKSLRRQRYEKLYVINKNGNVIAEQGGNLGNVFFGDELASKCKDNTLIHNHPNGGRKYNDIRDIGYSLSSEDVREAVSCNMRSMIAVTPTYRYEMLRPSKGWSVSSSEVDKAYNRIYKEVVKEYEKQLTEKRFFIVQHLTMKRLAKIYNFEYISNKK